MDRVLYDSTITARKGHVCSLCGCIIAKGTTYRRQTNVYDGEIGDVKTHTTCADMAQMFDMYTESDGVLTDEYFIVCVNEYIENKKDLFPNASMSTYDKVCGILDIETKKSWREAK